MKKWTPTFPNELPLWELKSRRAFESLKGNGRGLNSLDWNFLYTIGKLLKLRCLKWPPSYGQNKGQKSNCQFDYWPLKVKNRPNFLMCRWHATYRWKALDKGYNLFLNLISIKGSQTKLWASKVARVPISRVSGLQLGCWPYG